MLWYLDLANIQAKKDGKLRSLADLQEAIMHGAVKRIRPKVMTVACMFLGLIPIIWSVGTGADVMNRIAAPLLEGNSSSRLGTIIRSNRAPAHCALRTKRSFFRRSIRVSRRRTSTAGN